MRKVVLFVGVTLLPLQWFVVGGLRLHIVVILLCGVAMALMATADDVRQVVAVGAPFIVANGLIVAIWTATALYHGLGLRPVAQQGAFLLAFVAVAAGTHASVSRDRDRTARLLRWVGLASAVVLMSALSYSMIINGVNPAVVAGRTLAAGDPEILQKELFKSAFVGFGFDESTVRGNIRHEVFGALLLAMALASVAAHLRPPATPLQRWLLRISMVLGAGLIVLSMSRSVMIAALIWPLLLQLRSLQAGRLSRNFALILTAGIAVVSALLAMGLAQVLWVRFTQDTSSYDKRDQLLADAFSNLADSAFAGGVQTASASSHNLVVDTWLRAGVVAAGAAAVAVIVVAYWFWSNASRLSREPMWMVPATAMLALPLVRFVTAGGGLVPPVSWMTIAIFVGLLSYRRSTREHVLAEAQSLPAGATER